MADVRSKIDCRPSTSAWSFWCFTHIKSLNLFISFDFYWNSWIPSAFNTCNVYDLQYFRFFFQLPFALNKIYFSSDLYMNWQNYEAVINFQVCELNVSALIQWLQQLKLLTVVNQLRLGPYAIVSFVIHYWTTHSTC